MADLDDFFAKKDKKKLKGKKFDNLDEIGKRLEKSEKKLEKLQKTEQPSLDHEVQMPSEATKNPEPKEEEEWKDFHVETEKDLTDLKITNLQIEDEDDGGYGGGGSDDDGEGGTGGGEKHAWKSNLEREEKPAVIVEEVPIMAVAPPKEGDAKKGYVPPHMRNQPAASSLLKKMPGRKSKIAPDINNEMSFPSLSNQGNANPSGAWGARRKPSDDRGFENVKHGSTKNFTEDSQTSKLSTANRFDALMDNS